MTTPDSNERQVATTLEGIRSDHVARYRFAQKTITDLVSAGKVSEGTTAIDYGCGVGYGTSLLRDVCAAVYGVDRDEATLCFARDHWRRDGVAYLRQDLSAGALATHADVAVAFEIVEHLEDPRPLLKSISADYLLVSVPNEHNFPWTPDLLFHYRHYTAYQLIDLLTETGWQLTPDLYGQTEDAPDQVVEIPEGSELVPYRTLIAAARRVEGWSTKRSSTYQHPTQRQPESVMLCALGPSKYELLEKMLNHLYTNPCEELWTVNTGVTLLPNADAAFIMDDIVDYAERFPPYRASIKAYRGKLIGQTAFPGEAKSLGISFTDYPLNDVLSYWGRNASEWLHTISLGYVLAYAGFIGVKRLCLAGVDCSWPGKPQLTEAGNAVVCYWLGRLTQAGCEVLINSESALNSVNRRTAYEWRQFYGYLRQPQML